MYTRTHLDTRNIVIYSTSRRNIKYLRFFLMTFRVRIIQIPWDTSGFTSNLPAHLSRSFPFLVFPRFFLPATGTRSSFLPERGQPRLDCVFYPLLARTWRGMAAGGKNWLRYPCDDTFILVVVVIRVLEKHCSKHAIKSARCNVG